MFNLKYMYIVGTRRVAEACSYDKEGTTTNWTQNRQVPDLTKNLTSKKVLLICWLLAIIACALPFQLQIRPNFCLALYDRLSFGIITYNDLWQQRLVHSYCTLAIWYSHYMFRGGYAHCITYRTLESVILEAGVRYEYRYSVNVGTLSSAKIWANDTIC